MTSKKKATKKLMKGKKMQEVKPLTMIDGESLGGGHKGS